MNRWNRLVRREKQLRIAGYRRIAGIDEAGIGPLAGPVVAAVCILPSQAIFLDLNDSKQVVPAMREKLFEELTSHSEISYGIGIVGVETIDEINILQASFLAMKQALASLSEPPDYVLLDGRNRPDFGVLTETIIAGDTQCAAIAAASILAKVSRDRIMHELDKSWPHYGFAKHKGYPTKEHKQALAKWGPSPVHRRSFMPD